MAQERMISSSLLVRGLVLVIAAWSVLAGLTLTLFHGSGASALGAGVADEAGQRLAGAQMLVLAPMYVLIALRPGRFGSLLWLPFAGQAAVFLAVGYSMLGGETSFGDGILAFGVSGLLAGLLAFIWISLVRADSQTQFERSKKKDEEDENAKLTSDVENDES